jgi:hypothetical protein
MIVAFAWNKVVDGREEAGHIPAARMRGGITDVAVCNRWVCLTTFPPRGADMRISIKTRLFLSHFLAVVLVSGSIGTYFYYSAVDSLLENLKNRLTNTAAMAAESLDAAGLDAVRGPADVSLPAYRGGLAVLRRLRGTNPDIAFLYVMRREGAKTFFVLDSDETQAQAQPGTEYPDPPPSLLAGFSGRSVDDRLYEDAWGVFMSGYAPLRGGKDSYLLGIDMRDAEVARKLRNLRLSGIISLSLSLGLAFVFASALARRFNRPIRLFAKTCSEVAGGRPGPRWRCAPATNWTGWWGHSTTCPRGWPRHWPAGTRPRRNCSPPGTNSRPGSRSGPGSLRGSTRNWCSRSRSARRPSGRFSRRP